MPETPNANTPLSEAPLYIRWGADQSPFAVELKLDLVRQIREAMAAAENGGIEIGGVLVGSLPTAYSSTLRIEEVEMIARSSNDGATFMLDPGQHDRFAEVRWGSRERGRTPVGLFRSHLRAGQLRPSLADRTLLSSEFTGPVYALLLVQAVAPFSAAVFVAAHGQLPVDPSIRAFRFEESDFRALPEIDPESPPVPSALPQLPRSPRRWPMPAVVMLAAALAVMVLFFFSAAHPSASPFPAQLFHGLMGDQSPLQLEAKATGSRLLITWNRQARDLDNASGATLRVKWGSERRELHLGVDELRLGSVLVETSGPTIEATMAVNAPGPSPITQTVLWTQR